MPTISLCPPDKKVNNDKELSTILPNLLNTPNGLAIVEIQGTINNPPKESNEDMKIGNIIFPNYDRSLDQKDVLWMKLVYFYVGKNQRLTGKVTKLSKPLAIIKRKDSLHQNIDENQPQPQPPQDDLKIVDIIKYKIIFSSRPEPVNEDEGIVGQ